MKNGQQIIRWTAVGIGFGLTLVGASAAAAGLVRAMDFEPIWQAVAASVVLACTYLAVVFYSES